MRRAVLLLSLSLSAATFLPTAAHAEDLCNQVWVESASTPPVTTGPTCVAWPYSRACEIDRVWFDDVVVSQVTCFPQP